MGYLHPDKLINVRRELEGTPKRKKSKVKTKKRHLKRKRAAQDSGDLVRSLAYQMGAARAAEAGIPTRRGK